MIIYAKRGRYVALYDTSAGACSIAQADDFFRDNCKDILVTYNGEEDKKKYSNIAIYSAVNEGDILAYCVAAGKNCCIDSSDLSRATYDLTVLLEDYETLIQPRFNLFLTLIKKYKLSPLCFRMSNTQLLKEVLRWS